VRTPDPLDFAAVAAAGAPLLCVSDVHLRFGDRPYLDAFLAFLRGPAAEAAGLVIHGDLFEFYVGPRQGRHPFYAPLFDALRDLSARGVAVAALHGNRDFLLDARFEASGAAVIADRLELETRGLRLEISHGDEFCTDDRSYQFWARGVLRSPPARAAVRSLPLTAALLAARAYRGISRRKMALPRGGQRSRIPSLFPGAEERLRMKPLDALVCGHIHELAATLVPGTRCTLYTTGAWEDGPNFIRVQGGRIALSTFDPVLGRTEERNDPLPGAPAPL
jgi:UDP-2,3-diacylglucosamine hydrolase